MSRSADYTIKGFLYQFNKTLLEILNASEECHITVEGIVEDVEIKTPSAMTAIQCKYHEASETFTLSSIYKPLLQMMKHFYENPSENIRYVLFAHYPSVKSGHEPSVGKPALQSVLASKGKDLQDYVMLLRDKVDLDKFLSKFVIEFGPSYDEILGQVCDALKVSGIPAGDIDTLAYPNAIHMIAEISVKHDPTERITTKLQFLNTLKNIRKTAISRWTMALYSRKKLLEARRKQLKHHLDKNCRLRYLVVDSKTLDDYDAEIVLFISDYLDKYHYKTTHISTPVFCLCTSEEDFQKTQYRLYQKGIISTDGYVGGHFDESRFFRNPLNCKGDQGKIQREFALRLLRWEDHKDLLNKRKCDDLFIIGEHEYGTMDTVDVNVEYLEATTLKEVKYVMGVSNVYE